MAENSTVRVAGPVAVLIPGVKLSAVNTGGVTSCVWALQIERNGWKKTAERTIATLKMGCDLIGESSHRLLGFGVNTWGNKQAELVAA